MRRCPLPPWGPAWYVRGKCRRAPSRSIPVTRIRLACVLLLLPSLAQAADLERGFEALRKKEYDLAIVSFSDHIRKNPNDANGFTARASAYIGKREYDKAIRDCDEAIRLDPKNADTYISRGNAHGSKKEHGKAI